MSFPDIEPPFAVTRFNPDGRESWSLLSEPGEIVSGSWKEAPAALEKLETEDRWFGYLGYELCQWTEEIRARPSCEWNVPDFWFGHFRRIEDYSPPDPDPVLPRGAVSVQPSLSTQQHREVLSAVRRYLLAGDIYQANITVRFEAAPVLDPWNFFLSLSKRADAAFSAYIDSGDWKILSVSPELFLKLEANRLETIPIKGTTMRLPDSENDMAARRWLATSEKNLAELVMIVDLERNDLGRVCRTGSIRWGDFPEPLALPNVHHLSCRISGNLRAGVGFTEIVRAAFPGGSISGAPKRRALQILRELEPHRRGPYCGAIGYVSKGHLLLNVGIRTGVWKENRLRFWGGGGIVVDHNVEEEQDEIRSKLKPFLAALGTGEMRFWRE